MATSHTIVRTTQPIPSLAYYHSRFAKQVELTWMRHSSHSFNDSECEPEFSFFSTPPFPILLVPTLHLYLVPSIMRDTRPNLGLHTQTMNFLPLYTRVWRLHVIEAIIGAL